MTQWKNCPFSLLDILSQAFIPLDGEDSRGWTAYQDGAFAIASFFLPISGGSSPVSLRTECGRWRFPQGLCSRILTTNNLSPREKILVNACPMCLADEDTMDYLLLNCKVAQGLWFAVLSSFGCGWVLPWTIFALFEAWHLAAGPERGRAVWRTAFLGVSWTIIWKERNAWWFEDLIPSGETLAYKYKITIASYVCPFFLNSKASL